MAVRANKPAFNIREKLKELTSKFGLKGRELMSAATLQDARNAISAGRKNMIINGACMINQRFGSGTYTLTGSSDYYPVDRYRSWANGGGQFTIQRSDNAPPGFKNSIMYTVSTTDTSVGSSEYYCIQQRIEGYNIAHLGLGTSDAKPVTLSFWVKSDLPGTYSGSFFNTGQSYTCVFEYQINRADTWEYKTLTIPAATIGSFTTDSSNYGLGIWWDLGSGTGFNNTPFVWKNAGDFRSANQVPFIGTSGAKFRMTGVQLEVGKNATEFEHRSYGEELALCQRYYFELVDIGGADSGYIGLGHWWATDQLYVDISFPVEMRTVPTFNGLAAGTGPGYVIYYSGGATGYLNSSTGRAGIQRICKTSALTYWQYWKDLSNGTGTTVSGTAGLSGWLERRSGLLRINFSAEL